VGSLLELKWGEIAQHGVDTFAVVEHFDMGKDFSLGLVAGEQLEVVEVFSFETAVETFLFGICLGQDGTLRGLPASKQFPVPAWLCRSWYRSSASLNA